MTINPQVSASWHNGAAIAIDEALREQPGDPERLARMRRLGGPHEPPGGPVVNFPQECLAFLAEGLAGALEVVAEQERRIEVLEANTQPARTKKKGGTK